jgi:DNA-binding NtrC family response regulator
VRVDVRIIATTNRDLEADVQAGRFRRDLFYRINVVPIHMPALRERLEDVPLLTDHFVHHHATQHGIKVPEVPQETYDRLREMPWPGNVRELSNAVERALILARTGVLRPEVFEDGVWRRRAPDPQPVVSSVPALPGGPSVEEASCNLKVLERMAIERALARTGGHRLRAAELLGISERTLRNKLNPQPAVDD